MRTVVRESPATTDPDKAANDLGAEILAGLRKVRARFTPADL